MELNNREWAILCWLALAFVAAISQRAVRSGLVGILRQAIPLLFGPLVAMLVYVGLEVRLGAELGLWSPDLLKGTSIWVIAIGLVLLANYQVATDARFFRRTIRGAIGATVFVEFFINLVAFDFIWELLIQPLLTIFVLLSTVVNLEERHHATKKWIDRLLAVFGFSLWWLTALELYATWEQVDKHTLLLEFALPVWLTIGFLPFVYAFSLYVHYEAAFRRIKYRAIDWRHCLRAQLALVSKLHIKSGDVRDFHGGWTNRIASAPNFMACREVVDLFWSERLAAQQAIVEETERLGRYAGSDQVDGYGKRLDRREFTETIAALRYLSTCHMGWYRNRGGRYQADLLDRFDNDFTRQGLPKESGIKMTVASDGQAWYAWRRAITGWCFAIGAGGPPPQEWEYDGPNPPIDVPGKDPSWGSAPYSNDVNTNWH